MRDSYSREINYLRVSVTERCNLRCVYCMPEEGVKWVPHTEVLPYEDMARIVEAAAGLGVTKVRVTGGEPTVRAGIVDFIAMLSRIPGLDDISMTTNGTTLPAMAADLKRAGLKRVNISLDTLKPDRFRAVTRVGELEMVLAAIDAAFESGLTPVKINAVVMQGFNEDEIGDKDGDGWREFKDGWDEPIYFLRWAPGFSYERALGFEGASEIQSGDPVKDHDPFDSRRIEDVAFRMIPLIYSPGPDQEPGLTTDIPSDPYYFNGDPYRDSRIGAPDPNYPGAHVDNIHNHHIEQR